MPYLFFATSPTTRRSGGTLLPPKPSFNKRVTQSPAEGRRRGQPTSHRQLQRTGRPEPRERRRLDHRHRCSTLRRLSFARSLVSQTLALCAGRCRLVAAVVVRCTVRMVAPGPLWVDSNPCRLFLGRLGQHPYRFLWER
jgi:hypothetical protein